MPELNSPTSCFSLQHLYINEEAKTDLAQCDAEVLIYYVCLETGHQDTCLTATSDSTEKVQSGLSASEIPEDCVVEELQFWQAGHYGPICKGLVKKRDKTSSAVVVKTLRGKLLVYQRNEIVWDVASCLSVLSLRSFWARKRLIVV